VTKKRPREHNEKQKNSSLCSDGSKTIPDITYKNPQAEDQGLKQELRTKEVTSKQNQELPHTQQARAGTRAEPFHCGRHKSRQTSTCAREDQREVNLGGGLEAEHELQRK
jgi:hypothetical protein